MSETSKPTKISREGVILIKSFEGFRPRAIPRADGRWTIGYGHTQSAREGLTVSESDAELLLQYDLIPVARAIDAVQAPLNQHQYDALASFAFSVGVDRFKTSDVLARLNAGAPSDAADALVAWTDDSQTVSPMRRRAAERALFVANPDSPVSLVDLLAAPLPPPAAILVERTVEPEPALDATPFEDVEPDPFPAVELLAPHPAEVLSVAEAAPMTREAAVAALLGDADISPPQAVEQATIAAEKNETTTEPELAPTPEPSLESDVAPLEADDIEAVAPAAAASPPQPRPVISAAAFYSPYAMRALGPLSGFGAMSPSATPAPTVAGGDDEPADAVSNEVEIAEEMAEAPVTVEAESADAPALEAAPPQTRSDVTESEVDVPSFETPQPIAEPQPDPVLTPFDQGQEPAVEVPVFAPSPSPIETAPLELTGAPSLPAAPSETRLVWPGDNEPSHPDQTPLFEADTATDHADELPADAPAAAATAGGNWSETLTFMIMGGIGLLSFGAAMAAFRQASLSNGETALIGWVLVIIALACVGVSGFNLYQRWGRVERA